MEKFSKTMTLSLLFLQFFIFGNLLPLGHASEIENTVDTSPLEIKKVLELNIDSSINPATLNYLRSGVKRAHNEKFQLILITMNTPGGLVTTTKDILTLMGNSDIPIVIWITPEGASATSAGAIISAGSHLLFMSKGTNIGAATPVTIGGGEQKAPGSGNKANDEKSNRSSDKDKKLKDKKDVKSDIAKLFEQKDDSLEGLPQGSDMKKKAINDLVALVKSLSTARGRNGKLFGEMISKASSFEADEALKKNLINGIGHTHQDIFKKINQQIITVKGKKLKLDIQGSPLVVKKTMDIGQLLLNVFANPSLAYLLFLIGAALLYFELQAPGGFVAGSIGAILLVMAGIGFQVLPLNFGALALIVLSFILFVLEAYITSFGLLTLAGLTSLLFGSLFLFRSEDSYMDFQVQTVYYSVGAIAAFLLFIAGFWFFDARKNRKRPDKNDHHALLNKTGIVSSNGPLRKTSEGLYYSVKIAGEFWNALSNETLDKNDEVSIKEIDKEKLILKVSKKI